MKSNVVIGYVGSVLDHGGKEANRWNKWRPTLALCRFDDLLIKRMELLHDSRITNITDIVVEDIKGISPETAINRHILNINQPWDFQDVYGKLHDFASQYPFDTENEEYLIHITTGTHVEQICLFLLTETHYFPAKLIQTSPPSKKNWGSAGEYRIIDLDLSQYDHIMQRFRKEQTDSVSFLKSGIETRNKLFNRLIEQVEQVALHSHEPILLTGATGTGKSRLARRIYQLKKSKRQVSGELVEVNCATLRGDNAISTLFGHIKGAFTGAIQSRSGLLRAADKGLLFLDEIGELGLDEQAMLLRALEEKTFLPMGADKEVRSDFQLLAGTNRSLHEEVEKGRFREDLLARINLWTFNLPNLRERPEDIEPNIRYELEQLAEQQEGKITFHSKAMERFLKFATSKEAIWKANFRDLNACMKRMSTFAHNGRITMDTVEEEIQRLNASWYSQKTKINQHSAIEQYLSLEQIDGLDLFDKVQLSEVLKICQQAKNLSEAGKTLFAQSRLQKKNLNDTDRLRKYLKRFGIDKIT